MLSFLSFEPTSAIWPVALALTITVGLALLARRRQATPSARLFGWWMVAISAWAACHLLELSAATARGELLWSTLEPAAALPASLVAVLLACHLTGRSSRVPALARWGGALCVGLVAAVWTHPWHGLSWIELRPAAGSAGLVETPGLLFRVYDAAIWLGPLTAAVLLVRHAFAVRPRARVQAALLAIGALLPIVGGLFGSTLGVDPFPLVDGTILLTAVGSVLFAVAIFGFGALDLVGTAQRIVMEDIQTPILLLDLERRVVGANPFGRVLLGLSERDPPRPITEVWPGWPRNPLQPVGEVHIELLGERFYFTAQESSIPGPDGTAMGTVVVLTDITDRKELEERLADLAARDPLTHAWNRRAFERQAEVLIGRARRHGESLCLALCDLDRLKQINDRHGHLSGDRALIAFHDACAAVLRAEDLLARLGGDEFAVLFLGAPHPEVGSVLDRLRLAVAATRIADAPELRVSTSVGAVFVDDAATLPGDCRPSDLLDHADRALYEAKRAGRDRCTLHRLPHLAAGSAERPAPLRAGA